MRRRARTDANHQQIRSALRAVGWTVLDSSRFGDGWPDLVACRRGAVVFVEVKDGAKVKSRQKLTPDELEFRALVEGAGVPYRVVVSIEEAAKL